MARAPEWLPWLNIALIVAGAAVAILKVVISLLIKKG